MQVLLIKGGVVVNCIESGSVALAAQFYPDCLCMERTDAMAAGPGDLFDGARFTTPARIVVAPDRHITPLAFMVRFTDAEAIGIDMASQGATVQAASLRRFQAKVNVAAWIDLDLGETRGGLQALEAMGLIATGRAAAILDAPVMQNERAPIAQQG